jgi:hypothetical protein
VHKRSPTGADAIQRMANDGAQIFFRSMGCARRSGHGFSRRTNMTHRKENMTDRKDNRQTENRPHKSRSHTSEQQRDQNREPQNQSSRTTNDRIEESPHQKGTH